MEIHPLLKSSGSKPRKGAVIACKECQKEFYINPYAVGTSRKFCSLGCYNKAQTKRIAAACKYCGGLFEESPSKITKYGQKFCSIECYQDSKPRKPKKIGNRRTGLMARTKVLAQRYARLRDCGGYDGYANCISCGTNKHYSELDGGHFIPSTCSALKFDERNINAQCQRCNRFMHGAQANYLLGLEKKHGREVVDELMGRQYETRKWTLEELSDLYDDYTSKIAEF